MYIATIMMENNYGAKLCWYLCRKDVIREVKCSN